MMFAPLYTADEMRAAEQGHDVDAMMERAGRAVADAVLRRYPRARRVPPACRTGFHGAPRDDAAKRIDEINAARAPVVAVDVPSGVNASTGEIAAAAVAADVTVTMHGRKVGLAVAPGRFHAGAVEVAGIGIEQT